jgi:hypothetical protein
VWLRLPAQAPRNAQLALLVWRGRRRASPLNRLSCPVLCVFSGYVLIHHSFFHQSFIVSSSILMFVFEWRAGALLARRYVHILSSSSMLQFCFFLLHLYLFRFQPPTHPGVRVNT